MSAPTAATAPAPPAPAVRFLPLPAEPHLSPEGEKLLREINGSWSKLQDRRGKLEVERRRLADLDVADFDAEARAAARKIKEAEAEILRLEVSLLRQVLADWPGHRDAARWAAHDAASAAAAQVRERVVEGLKAMGFELDTDKHRIACMRAASLVGWHPDVVAADGAEGEAFERVHENFPFDEIETAIDWATERLRQVVGRL